MGINTLLSGESAQVVKQTFIIPSGTTYPILLSGNQVGATYGATKEDYFVISPAGICTYRVHSYDQATVEKALDEALATTNVPDDRPPDQKNLIWSRTIPIPLIRRQRLNFS